MTRPLWRHASRLSLGTLLVAVGSITTRVASLTAGTEAESSGAAHSADQMLLARVAKLEEEIAMLEANGARRTNQPSQIVQAPFAVVGKSGKPLFTVDEGSNAIGLGRVSVAPGTANNYVVRIANANGQIVAAMAEATNGAGVVQLSKDAKLAARLSEIGLEVRNAAGKEIATLGLDPTNLTRARLAVRGIFEFYDENYKTVVDGGALPDGRGAVRTWPNEDCRAFAGLRSPTCLMGVKP